MVNQIFESVSVPKQISKRIDNTYDIVFVCISTCSVDKKVVHCCCSIVKMKSLNPCSTLSILHSAYYMFQLICIGSELISPAPNLHPCIPFPKAILCIVNILNHVLFMRWSIKTSKLSKIVP